MVEDRESMLAVRARTALAACHQAWVQPLGGTAADLELTGLVEVHGVPHIVLMPDERITADNVRVTCTAVPGELSGVEFIGTLEDAFPAAQDGEVMEALNRHRLCMTEPAGLALAAGCITVMRLAVVRVLVSTDGVTETVALDAFSRAGPDLWAIHGEAARNHLDQCHPDQLLALARSHVPLGVRAASVTSLGADGMVLACFTDDGLTDLVIPFTPDLPDPRALGDWFIAYLAS